MIIQTASQLLFGLYSILLALIDLKHLLLVAVSLGQQPAYKGTIYSGETVIVKVPRYLPGLAACKS